MMQSDINILREEQMYEYFKSLTLEEQANTLENIINNIDEYSEDVNYIYFLNNVIQKLEEDIRYREIYYWNVYYLIDNNNELTKLGMFYKLVYTHHYIKAVKMYLNMSASLLEKNKVLYKNDKAYEYLMHFKSFVKSNEDCEKVLKKQI